MTGIYFKTAMFNRLHCYYVFAEVGYAFLMHTRMENRNNCIKWSFRYFKAYAFNFWNTCFINITYVLYKILHSSFFFLKLSDVLFCNFIKSCEQYYFILALELKDRRKGEFLVIAYKVLFAPLYYNTHSSSVIT